MPNQNKSHKPGQKLQDKVRACTGKDLHSRLRLPRMPILLTGEDTGHVGRSLCPGCHQGFLIWALDGVQGSRSGCGLGRNRLQGLGWAQGWAAAPAADAGHALLDANTPPISPGPRRHAWPCRQTGGRFVRVSTRSWNARPVTTHYTENNWEKIVQEAGACSEISKFPSPGSGEGAGTGQEGGSLEQRRAPPSGGMGASLWQGGSVALQRAMQPRSLLRVGRGDHAHSPRVAAASVVAWGPAWLCLMRHKTVAKAPRLDAHQVLGAAGRAGENPTQPTPKTTPAAPQGLCLASWAAFSIPRSPQRWVQAGGPVTHFPGP